VSRYAPTESSKPWLPIQNLSSFDVVIKIEASEAMDANGSALTLDKPTKDYCLAV